MTILKKIFLIFTFGFTCNVAHASSSDFTSWSAFYRNAAPQNRKLSPSTTMTFFAPIHNNEGHQISITRELENKIHINIYHLEDQETLHRIFDLLASHSHFGKVRISGNSISSEIELNKFQMVLKELEHSLRGGPLFIGGL